MARSISGHLRGRAARRDDLMIVSIPLTRLERVSVGLSVARSMQAQSGFSSIIAMGIEKEQDYFLQLVDICNSDPAHIENAAEEPPTKPHIHIDLTPKVIAFMEPQTVSGQTDAAYGTLDLSQGSTPEWFDGLEEIPF